MRKLAIGKTVGAGLFLAAILPTTTLAAGQDQLAITSVAVVDVVEGSIRPDQDVLIDGNRIAAVHGSGAVAVPPEAMVIDGRGKYLIPGLWDMHVHGVNDEPPVSWDFYDPDAGETEQRKTYMPLKVAFGITGVRELSGGEWTLKLRDDLEAGELLGPHLVAGSPLLDGPNPIFPETSHVAIGSPEGAREAVRSLHAQGYDFLKTYEFLSPESYRAIHEAAKGLGMEVSGEIPISVSLWEAVELGHRTVEHLTGVELACSSREAELRAEYRTGVAEIAADSTATNQVPLWNRTEWEPVASVDPEKCARLYAHLVENDVWVVPTLAIQRSISYPDLPEVRDNPRYKYLHKSDTDVAGLIEEFDPERRLRPTYDHRFDSISDLHEAGVGILAGSDLPGGFPLHQELEIFVEAGLTPAEALRTATVNPARYLGRESESGAIAPGRIADLVLLTGNPLEDISLTQAIEAVVLHGRYLDRAMLDRFLAQAEADARAWEAEN